MAGAKSSLPQNEINPVLQAALDATSSSGKQRSAQNRNGQYLRARVETASPTQLVILLYDGAIRFCTQAIDAMTQRNLEVQHLNLIRVQRILSELMGSLNRDAGGEVADNLMRVYTHMLEQLVLANLKDQIQPVIDVKTMLESLRETWTEVDRLARGGEPAAPAQPDASAARAARGVAPHAAGRDPSSPGAALKSPVKIASQGATPPAVPARQRLGDRLA